MMIFFVTLMVTSILAQEYEYEESMEADNRGYSPGHHRLVGAPKSSVKKFPFVVAFNLKKKFRDYASCTGSLITREWIITAAHCHTTHLPAPKLSMCVTTTMQAGIFQWRGRSFKCQGLQDGSVAVHVREGVVYIGVNQIMNTRDLRNGLKIRIKYLVRHVNGYHGGGTYGTFGGYDIMLIKLLSPAPPDLLTACLPGPQFKDSGIGPAYTGQNDVKLAGFGKYKRRTCLTDQYGASKFHMCEMNENCKTTPPPQPAECAAFLSNPTTPNVFPPDKEEIVILHQKSNALYSDNNLGDTYCFRSESPLSDSQGWCRVLDDAANFRSRALVTTESWGFCSRDCFLELKPKNTLRALETGVDILDDFLCNKFVDVSLKHTVTVQPEVLCIGALKPLNFDAWEKTPGGYTKLSHLEARERVQHRLQILPGIDQYVHSAGTCNGDSGGPVFVPVQDPFNRKRFVVLGVVSGGRGLLGNCGGMNNPTHYVRVKKMVPWIAQILQEDFKQVCVIN